MGFILAFTMTEDTQTDGSTFNRRDVLKTAAAGTVAVVGVSGGAAGRRDDSVARGSTPADARSQASCCPRCQDTWCCTKECDPDGSCECVEFCTRCTCLCAPG